MLPKNYNVITITHDTWSFLINYPLQQRNPPQSINLNLLHRLLPILRTLLPRLSQRLQIILNQVLIQPQSKIYKMSTTSNTVILQEIFQTRQAFNLPIKYRRSLFLGYLQLLLDHSWIITHHRNILLLRTLLILLTCPFLSLITTRQAQVRCRILILNLVNVLITVFLLTLDMILSFINKIILPTGYIHHIQSIDRHLMHSLY